MSSYDRLPTSKELQWLRLCAYAARLFSTCTKAQYFAVILAQNGRVGGVGYNGSPPGMGHCTDGFCPRAAEDSPSGSIYENCISNHAEDNAITWSSPTMRHTLVVNGAPCWDCAKKAAGAGIRRLVYLADIDRNSARVDAFLEQAGVVPVPVDPGEL